MRHIWEIFRYEISRNFLRKGYLFATFGVPVLGLILIVGYNFIQSQNSQKPEDQAKSILDQFDFEGIKKAGYVDPANVFPGVSEPLKEVLFRYDSETEANLALTDGDIDVFYVISDTYLETGEVILHLPGISLSLMNGQPIEQLFYTTLAGDLDVQLLTRLRSPITLTEYNLSVSADQESNEDANFVTLYFFVLVFLMAIFLTNGYLLQSIIEEKENRVIELLITSVRSTELLAGKIFAMVVLGILQIVVWVGSSLGLLYAALQLPAFQTINTLLSIRIPVDQFPILFAYFVLGYLFFAAIFGAVGAISNSMREGPGYAAIFTIPAAFPFYFFAIFLATPNAPLPVFLSIFPITAPISMMMRISSTQVPAGEIILSLSLLALSALGSMWLAGRLFRVQSLLSGKVPKLRDLPKLLRG